MIIMTKLFEKDSNGLLHEVPADQADALRATRRFTHCATTIEVLFTPEEEAERDAEEARAVAARTAREQAQALREQNRQAARQKLIDLGLTPGEMQALLGESHD